MKRIGVEIGRCKLLRVVRKQRVRQRLGLCLELRLGHRLRKRSDVCKEGSFPVCKERLHDSQLRMQTKGAARLTPASICDLQQISLRNCYVATHGFVFGIEITV